jgi:hypothetical protein
MRRAKKLSILSDGSLVAAALLLLEGLREKCFCGIVRDNCRVFCVIVYRNCFTGKDLCMLHVNNKTKGFLVLVALCSLCVSVKVHADKEEMLRKALGIGGVCLIAHGLYKFVTWHPIKGITHIVAGVAVGLGGICSDIISKRIQEFIAQNKQSAQASGPLQQLTAAAQTAWNGVLAPVGNEMRYEYQFSLGRQNLLSGKWLTGLDQMYDGGYHYVRGECRKMLYADYRCDA